MNTPKVSVVIPCYNVEKYLPQCLDSIVNQSLLDIELICVNDGSTDSTLMILQEYADRDTRVKIIDKPNSGYGASMNCGFDAAIGEYIGIVESDDFVDLDMFERLYSRAREYDLDVVKSGFYYYYSNSEEQNIPFLIASPISSQRTFCPLTDFPATMEMVEFFNMPPSIWSAIYRREFIRANRIRFHETPGASFQDTSFIFQVWVCAKRVRLMEECFLHYRSDNSSSSVNSPGKVYCICDEYAEMERFLCDHQLIKSQMEPILVRIKYDSYMWNYDRLSPPLQSEFIQHFAAEFARHQIEDTLQQAYFQNDKWDTLKKILKDPDHFHELQILKKSGQPIPDFYDKFKTPKQLARESKIKNVGRFRRRFLKGIWCLQDHGFWYTLRHACRKAERKWEEWPNGSQNSL